MALSPDTAPARSRPIDLVVVGAGGRMGRLVCELAAEDDAFELVGALTGPRSRHVGVLSAPADHAPIITPEFGGRCDLIIDFSSEGGASVALQIALRERAALLVGTTGLTPDTLHVLEAAAGRIPVLRASNTSFGVAVSAEMVELAARRLGPTYHVEIVESHHRHKKDAPSGTALSLGQAAIRGGATLGPSQYHSLRGGDVVGEHTVRFAGEGEYLEIRHVANSRILFARGALRAARWLVRQPPGLYSIADTLRTDR